jgi:hypothetical protein
LMHGDMGVLDEAQDNNDVDDYEDED